MRTEEGFKRKCRWQPCNRLLHSSHPFANNTDNILTAGGILSRNRAPMRFIKYCVSAIVISTESAVYQHQCEAGPNLSRQSG
mmetsp:Transcript_33272/g.40811  ORF Transcript_33272/g.40811 Transcript_33272/m.40811 type:complete len:82 (+) Transcript_33272:88-333(+)